MKKICGIVVLLFCILMPITVFANEVEKEYTEGRFIYHSRDGYVSICGYIGNTEEIIIPSSLSGKPVSQIEDYAFDGCTKAVTVYLPDTILFIGEHPFDGMSNLKKIESEAVDVVIHVPNGVTLVEKNNSSSVTTSESSQNETQENSTEKVTEQVTENFTQDSTKNSISGTDNQSGEKLENQTEKATDGSEILYDPSKNTDNKNQVTQETQKSEQNVTNKNDVYNESIVDKNNVGEGAADRIEPEDETNIMESEIASLPDIPVDDKKVAENNNNLPYALIIIVVIIVIAGTAGFIVYKKKK